MDVWVIVVGAYMAVLLGMQAVNDGIYQMWYTVPVVAGHEKV